MTKQTNNSLRDVEALLVEAFGYAEVLTHKLREVDTLLQEAILREDVEGESAEQTSELKVG
jgi:hypothetical protein